MKRVNLHLTEGQRQILKDLSLELGISIAELVRRAIDKYLVKYSEFKRTG